MSKFFVPYADGEPAAVDIKGHRVLILSSSEEDMYNQLDALGGSEVREICLADEGIAEESEVLANLAASINGGVVLTPPGESLASIIRSLEAQLPWIH